MPVLSNRNRAAATDQVDPRTDLINDHHDSDPSMATLSTRPTPAAATPDAGGRRRWPMVVMVLAVLAGVSVAGSVLWGSSDSDEPTDATVALTAVSAETRDLIEFTDLAGRMVYGDVTTITASSDGVITDMVAEGGLVERGMVVYEINAKPITVMYGDFPLYRELSDGVEGDDVLLLEQNLASLGYHTLDELDDDNLVDSGFTVDGVFDEATAEAVIRWQEDAGLPPTGIVAPVDVVVIDGPAAVSSVELQVGSSLSPGAPILELNALGSVDAVYFQHGGDIDVLVASGVELVSGQLLYAVADVPVTAVVTDVALERTLEDGVADGDDVRVVEEMLVSLGYDADGDLDVDEEFDEFTTAAISEWEEDLQDAYEGVTIDGVLALDEIVVLEPGTVVGSLISYEGDVVPNGSELWTATSSGSNRVVETAIAVADQDALQEGSAVDIEFPDGELVIGTVVDVATASTIDPTDPDADATLAVEIALPSVPASAEGLNELDVEVKLVEEVAAGATVVPVAALVATGDGGFAVEAVTTTGGTTRVAVEPGMFSDGWVEVTGIEPGTQVVVPS